MNTITVTGNVGRDPEIRYTQSGKPVANFSVADSRSKGDDKEVIWHNIVCFDEMAENVTEQLSKGQRVVVSGRFTVNKYLSKDGVEKVAHEIVADEISVSLRWKKKDATATLARTFDAVEEDAF